MSKSQLHKQMIHLTIIPKLKEPKTNSVPKERTQIIELIKEKSLIDGLKARKLRRNSFA